MEELLTAGKNGCFVDPKDTPSFAQTLADLANNTTDLVAFGWESRRRAEARGWDVVAERFREALTESIKK